MKTYRVGLIGCGFIGKVHAYAYSTLPFYSDPVPCEVRVKYVVNSRPETATALISCVFSSMAFLIPGRKI